jgi:hypothetical protein
MQHKYSTNFYNTKVEAFQDYVISVRSGAYQTTCDTINPWNAVYNITVAKAKTPCEEPPSCKSIFSSKINYEIQRRIENIVFSEDLQQYHLVGNIKKGKWID